MILIKNIYEFLNKNKLTISFCESASGGALSNLITSIENSSKIFKGSIIAYQNSTKINLVKIPEDIIEKHGAVSKETAFYMAQNTNKLLNSDICISITGNSSNNIIENKEPCFYYVGVCIIDKVYTYEIKLENKERNFNRNNIALKSLEILYELLCECDF